MFWHTDSRKGMIRAILYLNSANEDTGSFRYIKGSHKRDFSVEHKVSDSIIRKLQDKIINHHGYAGDLVIFDSFGFHSNYKKIKPRDTIIFEFQPAKMEQYPRSFISIPSYHLTEKVISKINIFKFSTNQIHGTVKTYQNKVPPFLILNGSIIKPIINGIIFGDRTKWSYRFSFVNSILFYFFKKYLKIFIKWIFECTNSQSKIQNQKICP